MAEPLALLVDRIPTPIGGLAVVADEHGRLRAVEWTDQDVRMQRALRLHYGEGGYSLRPAVDPNEISAALTAYFAGDLAAIDDLPVATGGTDFQRAVWRALRAIPCGETISYAALARRIGRDTAVRAVGFANGSNQRRRSLSSRDRVEWLLDRLWRRYRAQALAARPRAPCRRQPQSPADRIVG
jgi:methylated-DNA-[protein]-cysteine S-methyltransferase